MPKKPITITDPEVARDFHPEKNGDLSAGQLHRHEQHAVVWSCPEGHEYSVSVHTRVRVGCKVCNRIARERAAVGAQQQAARRGSLADRDPDLLGRWDFERNDEIGIAPTGITPRSKRDVFWRCAEGHSYRRSPDREARAAHCPVCWQKNMKALVAEQRRASLDPENSLACRFPEVAAQWDSSRNKHAPKDYAHGSNEKVWWKCEFGHSWDATIGNRTGNGSGCPDCRINASRMEILVYAEAAGLYADTRLKEKIEGVEADVYIPSKRLAIEIDGSYWHRDKVDKDRAKDSHFAAFGIHCYRLRQDPLPEISTTCVRWFGGTVGDDVRRLFLKIGKDLGLTRMAAYCDMETPINPGLYNETVARLPAPEYENSLAALHPAVSAEWHPDLNGVLTPALFSPGADRRTWWRCADCGHAWRATIKNRTLRESGCPECAVQRSRGPRLSQKRCRTCDVEFQPRTTAQVCCSQKCANDGQVLRRTTTACACCGERFEHKVKNPRVYCSDGCYLRARQLRAAHPASEVDCVQCGKTFLSLSGRPPQTYCSRDCHDAHKLKARAISCERCGESFVERSARQRRFCSYKCFQAQRSKVRTVRCEQCGESFTVRTVKDRRFCGYACSRDFHRAKKS